MDTGPTGSPTAMAGASTTIQRKLVYPSTRSPELKTNPSPSTQFRAYRKEM